MARCRLVCEEGVRNEGKGGREGETWLYVGVCVMAAVAGGGLG